MAEFDVEMGRWIRANRCRMKLSQQQLATILHRDRTTLARWELGRRRLSAENLCEMERLFGTSPSWDRSEETLAASTGRRASLCMHNEAKC